MTRPGQAIDDRYELIELLGRGAMAEVWAAEDRRLRREVALKLLSAEAANRPEVRRRFAVEARSAAALSHPNIALVYDSGDHDGRPYLVMERLPGRTLADEVAAGPLGAARACDVAVDVLAALSAAHAAGVVHRDIKPANVLVGAGSRVKVGDFGIAESGPAVDPTTGELLAGARYLAPERLAGGPATVAGDLYAVGVLLYEMLTGEDPFPGGSPLERAAAAREARARPLPEIRPELPPSLVAAVERAMRRDPAERFRTASEMAEALDYRLKAAPDRRPADPTERLPSAPRTLTPRPGPARGREATVAGTAVLAVLAFLAVAAVARSGGGSPESASAPSTTAPAQPLPAGSEAIPPGRYHTNALVPGVAFALDGGWSGAGADAADVVTLRRREGAATGAEVSFLAVRRVFRPDQRYATSVDYVAPDAAAPAPPDLVAWLRSHPGLRVTDRGAGQLGGRAAARVDVEATGAYPSEVCTEPCVLLFQLDAEPGRYRVVKLEQGKRMRLYVSEGLVLAVVAPRDGFQEAVAVAESVVGTVGLS